MNMHTATITYALSNDEHRTMTARDASWDMLYAKVTGTLRGIKQSGFTVVDLDIVEA
jgi:hypothetical protein